MPFRDSEDRIDVARSGEAVYLRVSGRGCARTAPIFEEFSAEMLDRGYRWFVVDLAACLGMDSTFMGVIVGLTTCLRERSGAGVSVVNADDHNRRLLEDLGLNRILTIRVDSVDLPALEMERLPGRELGDEDRLELVRRAHEHLVSIDERNENRFGEFLSSLTLEMGNRARIS